MSLFETFLSVILLSLFFAYVPKMFLPACAKLEKISNERSEIQNVKFLADSFLLFCESGSVEKWKTENMCYADSIVIEKVKEKEDQKTHKTLQLIKAECKLNGQTYDFYGVVEK